MALLTRDILAIESGINDIKKMFDVTITKNVKDYLGCRIDMSRKGDIMVYQPHIYKHLAYVDLCIISHSFSNNFPIGLKTLLISISESWN